MVEERKEVMFGCCFGRKNVFWVAIGIQWIGKPGIVIDAGRGNPPALLEILRIRR